MQQAIAKGSWEKGVQATSNEVWRAKALAAADLIPTRLRARLDVWQATWGPMYEQVQAAVRNLPPKTADPMANVDARVKPIVQAWRRAAGKA